MLAVKQIDYFAGLYRSDVQLLSVYLIYVDRKKEDSSVLYLSRYSTITQFFFLEKPDTTVLQTGVAVFTRERTAGFFIRFYVVHKEAMFPIVRV